MSLTSYDQMLKGFLNQKHVAKLYMEKIEAVFMKILIWTCCIQDMMDGARWVCWTHHIPVPATSTPVLPTALRTCSFSFLQWPLNGCRTEEETQSIFTLKQHSRK